MESLFSGAHFHLLINHAPLFGSIFALALLVVSFFLAPQVLRRTALVVLICTGIAGVASDLSGQSAEDAVRGLPGVTRAAIHAHEDMADKANIVGIVVGVLALGALFKWRREPISNGMGGVTLVAALFLSGAMAYTALLGGRVRHTEVRPGATPADAAIVEPPRVRPQAPPPG